MDDQKQVDANVADLLNLPDSVVMDHHVPYPTVKRFDLVDTWHPTPGNLQRIFAEAVKGSSEATIARCVVKVSWPVWTELKRTHPIIEETLVSGRLQGESLAAAVVLNTILDPENKNQLKAALFYLKAICRWNDQTGHLVGASPPGNDAKVISHELDSEKLLALAREISAEVAVPSAPKHVRANKQKKHGKARAD